MLVRQKLDIAIDDEIARYDDRFRTMLAEVRRNTQRPSPFQTRTRMSPAQKAYLEQKRWEWWAARYSEVSVVLYDPSFWESCDLSELGISSRR